MNKYIYPIKEEIEVAMNNGWSKEDAKRGFVICDYDGLGLLEIEAIGEAHYITGIDDEAAAKEAERIGYCKIIPVNELPKNFYYDGHSIRWFGWVDIETNRKNIEEYCKKYCN